MVTRNACVAQSAVTVSPSTIRFTTSPSSATRVDTSFRGEQIEQTAEPITDQPHRLAESRPRTAAPEEESQRCVNTISEADFAA